MRVSVDIKNIGITYQTAKGDVCAVEDVSFSVEENEFVAIIGPSGCGKSTLLKSIGSLIEPTRGSISINGKDAHWARKERKVGFVFQKPVLLPWRTVIDNVLFPGEIIGDDALRRSREKVEDILDLIGIADFKNNFPHELSGGMQQRVAIARALSFDPSLLLMDEPFGALDEFTRERLNCELLRIWQEVRHTIFFVTHSIAEAVYLADRIVVMSKRPGKIMEIINVPFERPRPFDIRYEKTFSEITQHAHRLLVDHGKIYA